MTAAAEDEMIVQADADGHAVSAADQTTSKRAIML
jgi:hypothetical protein